jgi:GxxExxY protein
MSDDQRLNTLSRNVIGAALDVHRHLGPGLAEADYEAALAVELALRRIPFARQVVIHVDYKGHSIGQRRLDLVVADRVVVELKCVEVLLPIHATQVLAYLRLGQYPLGLLVNFKVQWLKDGIRRLILTPGHRVPSAEGQAPG